MKVLKFICILLMLTGVSQLAHTSYILAKAHLAEYLIEEAWEETKKTGGWRNPWSWSDSYPVMELYFHNNEQKQIVLENAIGRNMAFAPAHMSQSGWPGHSLSTVISAHNDTHFQHLESIQRGDSISLKTKKRTHKYQVKSIQVIDSRKQQLPIRNKDEIILITCYPFSSLQSGTPFRLMVIASSVS